MTTKRTIKRRKNSGTVFPYSVSGNTGEFVTPAGRISYLLTKATLRWKGKPTEDEKQNINLTRFLAPVREVLDVAKLGFDQLLQRDLDDNRIVHELVPYILGNQPGGAPLFPPIVAVLLPFREGTMQESYGALKPCKMEHPEWGGNWTSLQHGDAFTVETPESGESTPGFGIVRWSGDNCRVVVLDGQHRAMALLGLHRVMNDDWPASATKFEVFYKDPIMERLKSLKGKFPDVIELPVMLTWCADANANLPATVRKLFVDINNNARIPSPSRILLLSDELLENHLTRRFLSCIRSEKTSIPLAAIEYDYPTDGRKKIGRWSCFSNIEIIRELIIWAIFRSRQVLDRCDEDVTRKGRRSGDDFNLSLQEELRVKLLGPSFEDGDQTMKSADISNECFPRFNKEKQEKLLRAFDDLHAWPIIELFSHTAPFNAHFMALQELQRTYRDTFGVSPEADLCYEAIFEGQGVFWTIKRGAATGSKHSHKSSKTLKTCWKLIEGDMQSRFKELRRNYYASRKVAERDASEYDEFLDQTRTIAAQGGLVLLLATLLRVGKIRDAGDRKKLAKKISDAISGGLHMGNSKESLLALGPRAKNSLNLIPKLEPRFAGHWRYLWLEIMMRGLDEQRLHDHSITDSALETFLNQGRAYYSKEILALRIRAMANADPTAEESDITKQARSSVLKELTDALVGFGYDRSEAKKVWETALSTQPAANTSEVDVCGSIEADDESPNDDFEPL